jgi:hypothetical protein
LTQTHFNSKINGQTFHEDGIFASINAAADWIRGEDMNGRKEKQHYTRNTGVGPFHLFAEGFRLFLFQTKRRNGVYRKIKKQTKMPIIFTAGCLGKSP